MCANFAKTTGGFIFTCVDPNYALAQESRPILNGNGIIRTLCWNDISANFNNEYGNKKRVLPIAVEPEMATKRIATRTRNTVFCDILNNYLNWKGVWLCHLFIFVETRDWESKLYACLVNNIKSLPWIKLRGWIKLIRIIRFTSIIRFSK